MRRKADDLALLRCTAVKGHRTLAVDHVHHAVAADIDRLRPLEEILELDLRLQDAGGSAAAVHHRDGDREHDARRRCRAAVEAGHDGLPLFAHAAVPIAMSEVLPVQAGARRARHQRAARIEQRDALEKAELLRHRLHDLRRRFPLPRGDQFREAHARCERGADVDQPVEALGERRRGELRDRAAARQRDLGELGTHRRVVLHGEHAQADEQQRDEHPGDARRDRASDALKRPRTHRAATRHAVLLSP
jgi:hypothetical protein